MTRSRAACPVPGWRRGDVFGEKKRIPAMLVPPLYENRQRRVAARGDFMRGVSRPPARAGKLLVLYSVMTNGQDGARGLPQWYRRPVCTGRGRARMPGPMPGEPMPGRYFAAPAPAAAATPSCCPVPPLAPIAPMILPFTVIGTPPSEAIGATGKVVKAVLPAANWSANILVGRRYMAAVRALPWEISADAIW